MNFPSDELRATIARVVAEAPGLEERNVDEILGVIVQHLEDALERLPPESNQEGAHLMAICQSWASLISHVLGAFYAPASLSSPSGWLDSPTTLSEPVPLDNLVELAV